MNDTNISPFVFFVAVYFWYAPLRHLQSFDYFYVSYIEQSHTISAYTLLSLIIKGIIDLC